MVNRTKSLFSWVGVHLSSALCVLVCSLVVLPLSGTALEGLYSLFYYMGVLPYVMLFVGFRCLHVFVIAVWFEGINDDLLCRFARNSWYAMWIGLLGVVWGVGALLRSYGAYLFPSSMDQAMFGGAFIDAGYVIHILFTGFGASLDPLVLGLVGTLFGFLGSKAEK